ncbi:HAMP domain-containing histidine kinase [Frankia sp. Ag45/Mut15]|uniref:Sensor-like histidine kinase SenX3 n=1 Tax=Frankia umida TaxID=573489 RepID=A0ABT0K679_9ACTN|nr:HAMP domain-containing sensor histidine kinase [Frankia umida]MCK9878823.1 HAMP domain-containing histidine kinase [Frankia umida]
MEPDLQICAIALGCSLAAPLLAAPVLHRLRRASLRVWAAAIVAVAVGGMAAGVAVTAKVMFLSQHDLHVVLLVVAVSGSVTAAMTLWLGLSVARVSHVLAAAAGQLGGPGYRPTDREPPSAELAVIARALDDSHRRLLAAAERERALEASRRELVAWVSHDLRTPVAGIRAVAEALDDGVVDDPAVIAAYHRTMVRGSERLTVLLDELFELSQLQAGVIALAVEKVRVADLVAEAIGTADPIARAKGVRLTGDVDELDRVDVDVVEFQRVLTNLIANAIRHTPSDGTVAVSASVANGRAELAVRDGCGGIPPDDLGRLFDAGYRGESARSPSEDRDRAGAGLGLAIVRALTEAHGGEVSVHNVRGGCRFVVNLPVAS